MSMLISFLMELHTFRYIAFGFHLFRYCIDCLIGENLLIVLFVLLCRKVCTRL